MSEKKLVCKGAIVECQFGDFPDTLLVLTQKKSYINDQAGNQKLIATDKELGAPFQAKTFGQCKLQPMGSSFKPCMPAITAWQGTFEKTQLKENQGYPLLEDSKGTCAIASSPCVKINFHGQVSEPSAQNVENADEDITAQLLPQINPKKMKEVSPYDGLAIALDGEAFIEQNRNIEVEITTTKVTFVPLGIPDFKGNAENEYLKFNINISENPAEKMTVEVFINGKAHYKEEISNQNMLSVGNHEWKWDGFGKYGDYDSKSFKEQEIKVEVTVWLDGQQKSHRTTLEKQKSIGQNWVDVSISRNIKTVIVTLRVNLKDGGTRGLGKANDVPVSIRNHFKKSPITIQTKSFEQLKYLALKGLEKHWSRKIDVKGSKFDFKLQVENTENKSMDDIKLVYNTNLKYLGSSNPGSVSDFNSLIGNIFVPERITFNYGFIKHKGSDSAGLDGWRFLDEPNVSDNFKYLAAHEIGHTILKAYGGSNYSYEHRQSSTLLSQDPLSINDGGFLYPKNGEEIDLMKYYNNDPYYYDFKRVFAQAEDINGLIWLSKLKIK